MKRIMTRTGLLVALLFVLSHSVAFALTIPPNDKFPAGFWDRYLSGRDSLHYGDPGWVKRMRQRRMIREQIAAGRTTLAALDQAQFALPVLLGRYSDASTSHNAAEFETLLFGDNSDGSMIDYYDEISLGQFVLSGKVYGWFEVANPQSYYDNGDNGLGNDFPKNSGGFVFDVVAAADSSVDYSQYDNDGPDGVPNSGDDDGYVDGVFVVYAGLGADQTTHGDPGNLWPVSSGLGSNEYETNDISYFGTPIKVNAWAIAPELYARDEQTILIHPIGVFCHEFGHILGMPDLYDRTGDSDPPDNSGSAGVGQWDLMASGSWGGDGFHPERPSHMSAWCKYLLGWVTPETVEQERDVNISQVESSGQVYRMWKDGYRQSSYFLIENRQQTGFDQYIEGGGLLIYDVDEMRWWGEASFASGVNNDDETHKLVDVEEAAGVQDLDTDENRGDDGDPWPGSSGSRTFDATSNPSSRDYDGNPTGVAVNNISDSGQYMSAHFTPAQATGYSLAYDEQGIYYWRVGFEEPTDYWSGVLFTAGEGGTLEALDIGFPDADISYTVEIYSSLDYQFGTWTPSGLLTTFSNYATNSGWETVALPESLDIGQGQDFFVSLLVDNSSLNISYDRYGERSGRSYASDDGVNFSDWISTGETGGDINIRARIRTVAAAEAAPLPAVSADSIAFGNVTGGKSAQRSFQLYNLGDAVLSATLTYSGPSVFAVSPLSATVAPGDSQTVTVTFTPVDGLSYTGSITIAGGESELTVALSGTGKSLAVFASSIGDETFSETEGSYGLWARLNDVLDNPEVWLVYSLDGGESFSERVQCDFDGEIWIGLIAAGPLGTVIPFYFEADDGSGATVTLPATAPASTWTLTVALNKPGDLDGDWRVSIFDLLDMLKSLGKPDDTGLKDLNGDGKVDIFDLLALLKLMSRD